MTSLGPNPRLWFRNDLLNNTQRSAPLVPMNASKIDMGQRFVDQNLSIDVWREKTNTGELATALMPEDQSPQLCSLFPMLRAKVVHSEQLPMPLSMQDYRRSHAITKNLLYELVFALMLTVNDQDHLFCVREDRLFLWHLPVKQCAS